MTTYTFPYADRVFTLSTEASQSSYGRPVLIDDAGNQYGPADIVIPAEAGVQADSIFAPWPARSAQHIVENRGQPVEISDADLDLITRFCGMIGA